MEEPLSRARAYFDSFTTADASNVLQRLVTSQPRTFEDEQLEFKYGDPRDEHIDSIWSKALGAFANNQGGVVVWGIRADRDNDQKLDFAHSLALVPDVNALRERLTQKYRFLTDPPLGKVQVVPIHLKDGAKEGFVVCYIPEGTQKAYKATKAKYPYYFRVGSDSVEIGNGWLRQLFYPAIHHKLSLHIGAQKTVPPIMCLEGEDLCPDHSGRCISIGLKNDGNYSLYEAMLLVKHGRNLLINWRWERFKRNYGRGHLEDGAIALASPLHPTLRSILNLMAIGNDAGTIWSITVFAKDMKPFHVELEQSALPVETGEPLVVPFSA